MDNTDRNTAPADQTEALRALATELARLNSHKFIQVHNAPARMVGFQFLRGLAFGFGSVVGASILVSLVAWWASQIEFLPIIGEWAAILVQEIDQQTDATTPSTD